MKSGKNHLESVHNLVKEHGLFIFIVLILIGVTIGSHVFAGSPSQECRSTVNTVFNDNFNRADSTVLGNGWIKVSGNFLISNMKLNNFGFGTHITIQDNFAGSNSTASAEFTSTDNNHGPIFGLILRYQDSNNYYFIYRTVGGSSRVKISKIVNGAETVLMTQAIKNPTTNIPFTMQATAFGNRLSVYINGILYASVDDAQYIGGKDGIYLKSPKNVRYIVDNFYATYTQCAVITQCNDGIDNDGDGRIDYPSDPGCSSLSDNSEKGTLQCDNGADDDGDGTIDYPNDLDCSGPSDTTEYGSCTDSDFGFVVNVQGTINGTYNGQPFRLTDYCADSNNVVEYYCGSWYVPSSRTYDCTTNSTAAQCIGGKCVSITKCNDGIDNDADGKVDYPADLGCAGLSDNDEMDSPKSPFCGNGVCEVGESTTNCSGDCPADTFGCYDSDDRSADYYNSPSGVKYFEKGTVTSNVCYVPFTTTLTTCPYGSSTDYCTSGGVIEFYCAKNGIAANAWFSCSLCTDGVCKDNLIVPPCPIADLFNSSSQWMGCRVSNYDTAYDVNVNKLTDYTCNSAIYSCWACKTGYVRDISTDKCVPG